MCPPGYYKPLTLEVRNNREDTLSVFLTTFICVYITLILLLWDLSTLRAISHFNQFYIYILYTYIYVYFIYIHILYTYIYIYIYIYIYYRNIYYGSIWCANWWRDVNVPVPNMFYVYQCPLKSSNYLIFANSLRDFNKYIYPQRSCHGFTVLLNFSSQSSSFWRRFLHHVKHILNI